MSIGAIFRSDRYVSRDEADGRYLPILGTEFTVTGSLMATAAAVVTLVCTGGSFGVTGSLMATTSENVTLSGGTDVLVITGSLMATTSDNVTLSGPN